MRNNRPAEKDCVVLLIIAERISGLELEFGLVYGRLKRFEHSRAPLAHRRPPTSNLCTMRSSALPHDFSQSHVVVPLLQTNEEAILQPPRPAKH